MGKLKIMCSCEFIILSMSKGVMQVEVACRPRECRHLGTGHQSAGSPRRLNSGDFQLPSRGGEYSWSLRGQRPVLSRWQKKKKKCLKERKFM